MPARASFLWWMSLARWKVVTLSDVTETIAGNLPGKWKRSTPAMMVQKNADGSTDEWSYAQLELICAAAAG